MILARYYSQYQFCKFMFNEKSDIGTIRNKYCRLKIKKGCGKPQPHILKPLIFKMLNAN